MLVGLLCRSRAAAGHVPRGVAAVCAVTLPRWVVGDSANPFRVLVCSQVNVEEKGCVRALCTCIILDRKGPRMSPVFGAGGKAPVIYDDCSAAARCANDRVIAYSVPMGQSLDGAHDGGLGGWASRWRTRVDDEEVGGVGARRSWQPSEPHY